MSYERLENVQDQLQKVDSDRPTYWGVAASSPQEISEDFIYNDTSNRSSDPPVDQLSSSSGYTQAEESSYLNLDSATIAACTVHISGLSTFTDTKSIAVHWFRKGLRLHDNPALWESIRLSNHCRCIYIIDPTTINASSSSKEVVKWRFLLESLEDLDSALRKHNSRLYVLRGQPAYILPQLFKSWHINVLSIEEDPSPYGMVRDQAIGILAQAHGVYFVKKTSHTLHSPDRWKELCNNKPITSLKQFLIILQAAGLPEQAMETIPFHLLGSTQDRADSDQQYGIPSLEDLGLPKPASDSVVWHGGESEALRRLSYHLQRRAWVACFEKPKLDAGSLLASPSGLGPYLNFGCLSPRLFYWKLDELYRKIYPGILPPLSLQGQLIVREYYYVLAATNARFDQVEGNKLCLPIQWKKSNPEQLQKLVQAQTGFPWIDAIMTQVLFEGSCHLIGRQTIISFITYGLLYNSWQEAAKILDELTLDGDVVSNPILSTLFSGSSNCSEHMMENPILLGRKIDPDGLHIRRYLPKLKGFPSDYIYEPWRASTDVQKEAGCVVGVDYPQPMMNPAQTFHNNMTTLKAAITTSLTRRTAKQKARKRKIYNQMSTQ